AIVGKAPVAEGEEGADIRTGEGQRPQEGTRLRHEQGSANPVATGIRHEDTEALFAPPQHGEDIETVTAYVLGRHGSPPPPPAGERGHGLGQQSLLDLVCDAAVCLLPAQLTFGLAAFDELTDLAANAIHRLDQFVVELPDFPATELHDTE